MNAYQITYVSILLSILAIIAGILVLALLINILTFFISPAIRRFWKIYFEVKNDTEQE